MKFAASAAAWLLAGLLIASIGFSGLMIAIVATPVLVACRLLVDTKRAFGRRVAR